MFNHEKYQRKMRYTYFNETEIASVIVNVKIKYIIFLNVLFFFNFSFNKM